MSFNDYYLETVLFNGHLECNIKEFREENGLPQNELASKCGLSQNTISSYENGVYYPSLKNAILLSIALDVDFFDLFTFSYVEVVQ